MAIISFEIPDNISHLKLSPTQEKNIKNKLRGQYLGEVAEVYAVELAEKIFGQKFHLASYNHKGWDIISEDGLIKIEVKQTSCLGTKTDLSIGSTWGKKGECTHIMIFDLYNEEHSISLIPHDKFFKSNFHGKVKLWRWNKDYNLNNQTRNTRLFLEYKINQK